MKNIALCIICKGDSELEDLKIAVESAKDYVEKVYITTNAELYSDTKAWCEANGYKHSHLPWNKDYSEQRNFNFAQVADNIDYILWLDSDDYLVGGEYLDKVVNILRKKEYDLLYLTYWYGCKFKNDTRTVDSIEEVELFHHRERIIKKDRIYWKGRIHETPVTYDGMKSEYTTIKHLPTEPHPHFPIAVLHRKATRTDYNVNDLRSKRNLEMLELQLEDERKLGKVDPRTLLYLMKMYKFSNEKETLIKCITMGEEYINNSGWDEERSTAYVLISDCFYNLGEYERAKSTLLGALDEWPHNKEIFLSLANVSFALQRFRDMKLYMDLADSLGENTATAGNRNPLDNRFKKYLLEIRYYLNVDKNIKKAYKAAKELAKIEPNENNEEQVDYLSDMNDYNEASRNIDEFTKYLAKAHLYEELQTLLENFPKKFRELPFYNRLVNMFGKPKTWGEKEICYYASFGGPHFEKWDPTSLESGIGGSETAVIRLAQEWTKLGYKVTVYSDPKVEGNFDGVEYKSFNRFNPKDNFNIFIQWRSSLLAEKVVSKKFFVDLHDMFSEKDYLKKLDSIDKIFVKSKYHRSLAPGVPDNKFEIVSNGI